VTLAVQLFDILNRFKHPTMKFFSQAVIGALSLLSVGAVQQQADIYYHEKPVLGPSMWHFNPDGLVIFAPNGDVLKAHDKKMVCPSYTTRGRGGEPGEPSNECYYYTWASDGHKYVWAGSMAGDHHVQAFDIDTGDYAGYMDTCSTPLDMDYHPARRELYVRCAQEDTEGGSPGEIDVFSSATLSSDLPMIKLNATVRPYGRMAIHSSLGPYGYSVAYNYNFISEMDLSSKEIKAEYKIPDAHGGYDTTFSPVNQHLYFRARVCCTCNTTETDVESCGGRGKPVLVTTGPSKSDVKQLGVCSGGCEGSPADTIGVVEFDTVNKVFIDNHNIKEGTGWGANPVASPDGKWIVLLGNDGGQNIRVLQAGKNGQSSGGSIRDIAVDFEGGTPRKTVVSDVAFVQDENREIIILGASTDNNIVLVDLKTFDTRKLNLAPGVVESTGGRSRVMEWAVGTDYVWVNGGESKEAYIIKITGGIKTATLDRTLSDVAAGQLVFVNNYERMRAVALAQGIANTQNIVQASPNPTISSDSSTEKTIKVSSSKNANDASDDSSSSNSNVLSVVALILSALSVVAGFGALALVMSQKSSASALAAVGKKPDAETADGDGDRSLGSKLVN